MSTKLTKKQKEMLVRLVTQAEVEHETKDRSVLEKLVDLNLAYHNKRTDVIETKGKVHRSAIRMVTRVFYVASPLAFRTVEAIKEAEAREAKLAEMKEQEARKKDERRPRERETSMKRTSTPRTGSNFAKYAGLRQVDGI